VTGGNGSLGDCPDSLTPDSKPGIKISYFYKVVESQNHSIWREFHCSWHIKQKNIPEMQVRYRKLTQNSKMEGQTVIKILPVLAA
jgi:hypothetical protein